MIALVIRYERASVLPDKMRQAVRETYVRIASPYGIEVDGKFYSPFDLKRNIYLLDNLDLFIDDSVPELVYGYFLKVLRCYGFMDYMVIVPSKMQ